MGQKVFLLDRKIDSTSFKKNEKTWRLFEFGDLNRVPKLYHLYLREFLVFFYKVFGYYKLWVPEFEKFIEKTQATKMMECCSGAGDPLVLVHSKMDPHKFSHLKFLLSDIQPHPEFIEKFNKNKNSPFHYIDKAIDVTKEQSHFDFPKIFINSFHHFSLAQVKGILKSNSDTKNEIIIMEYVRNSILGYLSMFTGPLVVLLALPFVVKLKHLPVMAFFTYIIPLFPLMFFWDGLVSCKHEYRDFQLNKIISKLNLQYTLKKTVHRNLMYPAGVSVITLTFKD